MHDHAARPGERDRQHGLAEDVESGQIVFGLGRPTDRDVVAGDHPDRFADTDPVVVAAAPAP